jgi:non-heme chloroperoxidase
MKAVQYLFIYFSLLSVNIFAQVKEVRVGDAVFHYTDQGIGDPVIFIHGGLEDYRVWEPVVERFAKNFRMITYSRRFNYPNTNTADVTDFSQESEADDLAGIMKALDLAPAHIVGHSVGGLVAIAFAKKYPHLVKSVVLSEPPLYEWLLDLPEGEDQYAKFYNELWRPVQIAFDLRDTADVLRHTFTYFYGEDLSSQLPPEVRSMIIANFPEWKAFANSKTAFKGITREDVQHIKAPVMLISAGNTFPAMKLTNAELQRLLPNAKRYHFAEGTHDYWFEHPDIVGGEVLSFLQTCSSK